MSQFKRVGLIGRLSTDKARYTTRRLIEFLQLQSIDIIIEAELAEHLGLASFEVHKESEIGAHCDLAIVIGGDGSLLGAARATTDYQVPLLGVNRGRLGFLTDIMPDEIESKVLEVLKGDYVSEERFLLDMRVFRAGQCIAQGDALNDVVLHPGRYIRMIEFELHIDGQFVYSQRSDGLIVSTPTGSTAYALSGGGPLMQPKLNAMVLVPLNAHTLTSRPIVISGDSEITLIVGEENSTFPHVTCDGQTHSVTEPGDEVRIAKKEKALQLIHPKDHNFYETCRTKLGWASHLTR